MALERRGSFLLIYAVDQQLGSLLNQAMESCPLTPGEFAITSVLRLTGPCRPGELAEKLGMRPSTLSNHLRRFEERGLVVRRPDPHDGRAAQVRLSRRGRNQTISCFPAFQLAIETFHKELEAAGVEVEELNRVLEVASSSLAAAARRL